MNYNRFRAKGADSVAGLAVLITAIAALIGAISGAILGFLKWATNRALGREEEHDHDEWRRYYQAEIDRLSRENEYLRRFVATWRKVEDDPTKGTP